MNNLIKIDISFLQKKVANQSTMLFSSFFKLSCSSFLFSVFDARVIFRELILTYCSNYNTDNRLQTSVCLALHLELSFGNFWVLCFDEGILKKKSRRAFASRSGENHFQTNSNLHIFFKKMWLCTNQSKVYLQQISARRAREEKSESYPQSRTGVLEAFWRWDHFFRPSDWKITVLNNFAQKGFNPFFWVRECDRNYTQEEADWR